MINDSTELNFFIPLLTWSLSFVLSLVMIIAVKFLTLLYIYSMKKTTEAI